MTKRDRIIHAAEIQRRKRIVEIERDWRLRRFKYAPRYQPLAPFEYYVWREKKVIDFLEKIADN